MEIPDKSIGTFVILTAAGAYSAVLYRVAHPKTCPVSAKVYSVMTVIAAGWVSFAPYHFERYDGPFKWASILLPFGLLAAGTYSEVWTKGICAGRISRRTVTLAVFVFGAIHAAVGWMAMDDVFKEYKDALPQGMHGKISQEQKNQLIEFHNSNGWPSGIKEVYDIYRQEGMEALCNHLKDLPDTAFQSADWVLFWQLVFPITSPEDDDPVLQEQFTRSFNLMEKDVYKPAMHNYIALALAESDLFTRELFVDFEHDNKLWPLYWYCMGAYIKSGGEAPFLEGLAYRTNITAGQVHHLILGHRGMVGSVSEPFRNVLKKCHIGDFNYLLKAANHVGWSSLSTYLCYSGSLSNN
ncbi:hypothetical protein [Candidatus Neptunochlamydia vexilliferae]|uniref:hypothetical protein n=1 Tax=Candidatus Neptunichlamydia vexilliferae TaxID=1651774 RepID=UPI001891E14F|nr:hypothetical protein [Candidatus Neptunochlamydia vexilliferae]